MADLNFEGRITVKDEGSKEFADAAARMENARDGLAMRGASPKWRSTSLLDPLHLTPYSPGVPPVRLGGVPLRFRRPLVLVSQQLLCDRLIRAMQQAAAAYQADTENGK